VNNHGANVLICSKVKMLAKLRSHVKRILSPDWCDSLVDSTAAHGNKKVSKGMVSHQLLWGMLTGKKNLRDIETQSELVGDRISDTTMTGILGRLTCGTLADVVAKQIKQALAEKELRPFNLPYNMVAIDGKNLFTVRGKVNKNGKTASATKRRIMALRATLVNGSVVQVLGQRMIPNKSAETRELISFLKEQEVL
jgi:hypothetical protein